MKRASFVFVLASFAGVVGRTQPAPIARVALSELFKPGVAFQDRNGDGAIDYVNARLALPQQPGSR